MNIYNFLYPVDTKFESQVQIWCRTPKDEWKFIDSCEPIHLLETIKKIRIYKRNDYYITANTLIPGQSRSQAYVFSLNNIVLDFDVHNEKITDDEREWLIDDFVWRLKRDLFTGSNQRYTIPPPNIIHYTGRGVQLWWHIEETSKKLSPLYHLISEWLQHAIKVMIDDCPYLVDQKIIDKVASGGTERVYRMFNTYNTKTEKRTHYELLHQKTYDLTVLRNALVENDDVKDFLLQQEEQRKVWAEQKKEREERRKEKVNLPTSEHKAKAFDPLYTSTLKKRLWIIDKIIDRLAIHDGVRGKLLFVAWNCARSLWREEEAKRYCRNLNERFNPRFRSIEYLFRSKTKFRIKDINIPEYFNISPEEYQDLSKEYFRIHRNDARNSARKSIRDEKTAIKAKAAAHLASGHKITDVAEETGLSISSVKKISASQNKNKPKEKPWELLGISRATYYRRKKNEAISPITTQNSGSNDASCNTTEHLLPSN